jgi:histidinol phosphatase-like PHP family hydrolase
MVEYTMLVRQNMHTHTRLSLCAKDDSTVANTIAEADSVGLEMIGLCDHIDVPNSGREALMQRNRDELAGLAPKVKVLIGAEISMITPDRHASTNEFVRTLDYVVISANHFHLDPLVQNPAKRTEEGYADWFLLCAEGAVKAGASIIPHPFSYIGVKQMGDGRPVDRARLLKAYDRGRIRRLFQLAAERGTAFELNPHRMGDTEFFREIVKLGRDQGTKFSFGSDGHVPGTMHYGGIERLRAIDRMFAKEIGVIDRDICQDYAVRL